MFIFSICIILTSFIASYFTLYKIISISHLKHLFDYPSEERKIHLNKTPNLGGVALFFSLAFCTSLYQPAAQIHNLNYLVISTMIIFLLGLTDDLVGVDPMKKFGVQIIVALIITMFTQFRINSMFGFMGIYEIPEFIGSAITVLFILLSINAFNLIDGINCLASGIALLSFITFTILFWKSDQQGFMLLGLALCGSLFAFILYNKTPAKIFLGDSGSLTLGLLLALFSIQYLNISKPFHNGESIDVFIASPTIIVSLLIIPFFDTIRVFTIRLLHKKSPFFADRNHIHHLLLDLNFTHLQASGILILITLVMLSFALIPIHTRLDIFILFAFSILALFCRILIYLINNKKQLAKRIVYPMEPEQKDVKVHVLKDKYAVKFSTFISSENQNQ